MKDKAKNFGPAARIESGPYILLMETLIYWAAHTACAVATGYFLWCWESDEDMNNCKACNNDYEVKSVNNVNTPYYTETCNTDDQIDVQERFSIILKIYFAFFVTQWARDSILIIACIAKSPKIATAFVGVGCLNCCLGLAALIILHVFRFQNSGKICSGDWMSDDQKEAMINAYKTYRDNDMHPMTGQFFRGQFLLGLVIFIWVGGFFLGCVGCICQAIHRKKHPN